MEGPSDRIQQQSRNEVQAGGHQQQLDEDQREGESVAFMGHRSAKLATTADINGAETSREHGDNANAEWRRVRLERVQRETPAMQNLQATVERLERQLQALTHHAVIAGGQTPGSYVDSSVVRLAQKRLRFDTKDVHASIDSWDHFFRMYEVTSDREKFFAVEQLLPHPVQRALNANGVWETSYAWLVSYLRKKFEPKHACHEMGFRSVSVKTNMNELEDLAAEAAACPREHLIKHFMLEACSVTLKQK